MILGVDIGGTFIKYGVLDDDCRFVFKSSEAVKAGQTDREIVNGIIRVCQDLTSQYPVRSIGLGSPGHVLAGQGMIKHSANLPFVNTPIVNWIRQEIDLPIFLGNDANCAALGEFHADRQPDIANLVLITLGTGVGGGIIINRKLYLGKDEEAGEIGHMSIDYQGLPCRCGRIGCFEAYASVNALIGQTQIAIRQNPESLLAQISCNEPVSGKTAFNAAKAGCPAAAIVVDQYIHYLATGIRSVIMILRPDVIVLAGGITNEGANLLDPLKALVPENCELRISKLKNDAGMVGAALLGIE